MAYSKYNLEYSQQRDVYAGHYLDGAAYVISSGFEGALRA